MLDSPKTSGTEVTQLRQTWAAMSNQALERAGIYGVSYTELSHEDRGLDAPTVHLGPSVTAMERRGIKTDRGNENRRSAARNADLREVRGAVEQAEAEVIDLERERQAKEAAQRADPLAHYRKLVEDAERSGDPWEVVERKGWLRKAAELVEAGKRPALHSDELMKAGREALLAWTAERDQAGKEPESSFETAWEATEAVPETETPEQAKLRRWQAMSAAELKQEIQRLEPLWVPQRPGMAEAEAARQAAEDAYKRAQEALETKRGKLQKLFNQGGEWRNQHPILNWLHQWGLREDRQYGEWQSQAETLINNEIPKAQQACDAAKAARKEAVQAEEALAVRHRADREQEVKAIEPGMRTLRGLLAEREREAQWEAEPEHDQGIEPEPD